MPGGGDRTRTTLWESRDSSYAPRNRRAGTGPRQVVQQRRYTAAVPIISVFFGIVVRMLYKEHEPPHFLAEYQVQ